MRQRSLNYDVVRSDFHCAKNPISLFSASMYIQDDSQIVSFSWKGIYVLKIVGKDKLRSILIFHLRFFFLTNSLNLKLRYTINLIETWICIS